MSDEIPIKILIPEEEDATTIPVVEEPPLVPEVPGGRSGARARQAAKKIGKGAGKAARRVWRSEARRKVTRGMRKGATAAAAKGTEVIGNQVRQTAERQAQERVTAVQTRLRETDWKEEAKTGTAKGLHWLSQRLSSLAARLTPQKNPPTESEE